MSRLDQIRPSGLHHNPAYSHVVTASGARTIYISGQVSVDEEGRIVGEGDLAAQTTQVMQNLGLALKGADATYANVDRGIAESEVRGALLEFEPIWNELFPAEQARVVELLVERVDLQPDAIDLRLRIEGLTSLLNEIRGSGILREEAA